MLPRRLPAGPSRAQILTQFAAAAAASDAPTPRPVAPLSELEQLVGRVQKRPTAKMRKSLWDLYSNLSRVERTAIPPDSLRTLLRVIVPRHDEAWAAVQKSEPRHRKKLNDTQAEAWGRKMRSVIADMVDRGIDERRDWHFILQCLLKVGAVSAVEAVWQSIPPALQGDREFAELRLGTIIRYAKNARAAERRPEKAELELAYQAFWNTFQTFQNPEIKTVPITNRLLVVASAELAGLMRRVGNEEALKSFHQILAFVLKSAYGLDLENVPLSMDRRAQARAGGEGESKFRDISPIVLNAVLEHLRGSGMPAAKLFATFDIVTNEASTSTSTRSFDEDEEDDEFVPPPPNVTEEDPDRRNWFGRRVNRENTSYFDSAKPAETPEPKHTKEHRFVCDYLPAPVWPQDVAPNPSAPLPKRQPYNPDTVLILLRAAGDEGEWGLMARLLESSVADSLERDSAWLASYLGCAPEGGLSINPALVRPSRVSPEWFACALGEYTSFYDRHAPRTVHLLKRVVAWTQQKIDVVVASETARASAREQELHVIDGRLILPPPDVSAKKLRFMRNDNVFLPADELRKLYRDRDEFRGYLARATALTVRRAGRYSTVHARQIERREAEALGVELSDEEADHLAGFKRPEKELHRHPRVSLA